MRIKEKCPAWGKQCQKCHKMNHSASQCKAKLVNAIDGSEEKEINHVAINQIRKAYHAWMIICGNKCKFLLDSGATTNLIPKKYIPNVPLEPTKTVLKMWNGSKSEAIGIIKTKIKNPKNNEESELNFFVVEDHLPAILGAEALVKMNLIQINLDNMINTVTNDNTVADYDCVFSEGLGCFPGFASLMLSN